MTWTVQVEHQHVRPACSASTISSGIKLELELPPRWTFDAILETNNKYDAQFEPDEMQGRPLPGRPDHLLRSPAAAT